MRRKILTATLLSLCIAAISFSQIPSQIVFSRLTKKEGLASNTTFQTVQDKNGFLWIATQNGLQRYDGNRFVTFRHIPGDSASIAENALNHLFIDKKSRLWLLFDNKLGLFNTTNFKFTETKIASPVSMVKKLVEDAQGNIILFADSKQFLFDEKKTSFPVEYKLTGLPAGYTMGDMAVDSSTSLYWITGKAGSLLYDYKQKQFHSSDGKAGRLPALDSITRVKNARYPFVSKDGSWWMVNWIPFTANPPILYKYDRNKNEVQRFEKIRPYKADSYYEIWNVFQQSNGTIWAYGMGLLAYYHPNENRFVNVNSDPFQQFGIEYDYVSNLFEDHEKNVWVSTNKGVYRFNVDAQVFQNIRNRRFNDTAIIPNAVSAIVQTKNNGIWVSTWGAGILSYDEQLQPIPNPIMQEPGNANLHASSMIERKNGEIWIGLQTGGLKIYQPSVNKVFSVSPALLQNEIIQHVFEDSKSHTWIGTSAGLLVKCDKGNWNDSKSFHKMIAGISDIFRIYEDAKGHIWICTSSSGVYEVDGNTGKVLRQLNEAKGKNDGLLNNGATDILQYNDSTMLIASEGLCIFNNRRNTFTYLSAAEGLPAEHITALVRDHKKRLWIACDGGLYRLNIESKLHVSYDAADGIVNNVFQVASATVLKDGRIALGTPKDFVVFDPEKTVNTKEVPPVVVTGFILGSRRLPVDSVQALDKLRLKYDNTFTRIELSTMSFRDKYYQYYMLDGLDRDWKQVSNNEIIYQYLPEGNYTLRLKSMSGEGVESNSITMLPIKVYPPFWNSWWFYSLLVLAAAGLLFWFDHERIKRKTAVLKMRSSIADNLHEDINAALGKITILSEMARIKADKEPEKSKEFIEQIHLKSRSMTLAMEDILWSLDPENDSMESFMSRFTEYTEALKAQHDVRIDVLLDEQSDRFQLKMKNRSEVFWLFKTLITHVVEVGGKDCKVHIKYEKPDLKYSLQFDPASVDTSQLGALVEGKEIYQKLDALSAKVELSENSTTGMFHLSIPVRRD